MSQDWTSLIQCHIAVSGNIAAGKTTLSNKLSSIIGIPVFVEPVVDEEESLLPKFYQDRKKWAFPLQINFLSKRFAHTKKIEKNGRCGIQDRTIYEDKIFARVQTDDGVMEEDFLKIYEGLFDTLLAETNLPDFFVFLDVSPSVALKRIKERGRDCEKEIQLEYLEKLDIQYQEFLTDMAKQRPVFCLNWNTFQNDTKEILKQIATSYTGDKTPRLEKFFY